MNASPESEATDGNPYAAPKAAVSDAASEGAIALYSPNQVALGSFLGGPLGVVHFLNANFRALENERSETQTLMYGTLFVVALIFALPMLPEGLPAWALGLAYIFVGRYLAWRYQLDKDAIRASDRYRFRSNWRVLGMGVLCGIASAFLIGTFSALLAGLWSV